MSELTELRAELRADVQKIFDKINDMAVDLSGIKGQLSVKCPEHQRGMNRLWWGLGILAAAVVSIAGLIVKLYAGGSP